MIPAEAKAYDQRFSKTFEATGETVKQNQRDQHPFKQRLA